MTLFILFSMQFPINDKFVLNQDEAWYTLLIETHVPIDTVLLQVCNLPLLFCSCHKLLYIIV